MADFLTKSFALHYSIGKILLPFAGIILFLNFLFIHAELYYIIIPLIAVAFFISRETGEYNFFYDAVIISGSAYLLFLFPVSDNYLKALIWGIITVQLLIEIFFEEQLSFLSEKILSGSKTSAQTLVTILLVGIIVFILAAVGVSAYPGILRFYTGPVEYLYYVTAGLFLISAFLRFHSWEKEWLILLPVTLALTFSISIIQPSPNFLKQALFGLVLSIGVSSFAASKNSLDKSGMYSAALLGFYTFGLGGIKWAIPLLVFFISSSVITQIREVKNCEMDQYFEKSGARDRTQVYANGGIGIILVILYLYFREELFYRVFVIYIAAACADTWATEIGGLFKKTTISIRNFRKVNVGESGGVSLPGTIGALSGAFIIGVSSWFLINDPVFTAITAVCGFLGSLADSLLGATLQVQYKCSVCEKTVEKKEHCGKITNYVRGYSLVNNNFVNIVGGTSAVFIYLLLVYTIL